jgi:hypothetical protein
LRRAWIGARGLSARLRALSVGLACLIVLAGCGGGHGVSSSAQRAGKRRSAVERYVRQVEPIRLAVNRLLDRADPILDGFGKHRISSLEAARRFGALERRFASYAVAVAAIESSSGELRALNRGYAETYVLEDAYLSALTAGLADGKLEDLPNTQAVQRAAIIRWRIGLMVLARAAGVSLPADLQQAGRGEIAPSLDGS